jgi:hypothetical protein
VKLEGKFGIRNDCRNTVTPLYAETVETSRQTVDSFVQCPVSVASASFDNRYTIWKSHYRSF